MKSLDELVLALKQGASFEYLYFWGHRPAAKGAVAKSCFSQWFAAPFEHEGRRYVTAEHFMMARKAELFGDLQCREEILKTDDPGKAKALGRRVRGFDEQRWLAHRWEIVMAANRFKFRQNDELGQFLLSTGVQVLVEASPVDAVWGIGLAADAPEAADPHAWRGLNLLGFALMEVRRELATP
jgi:ribA/ribD-fused uncharacterized protein